MTEDLQTIRERLRIMCDFLQWAYDNQGAVKEPLWYALLTSLIRMARGVELLLSIL